MTGVVILGAVACGEGTGSTPDSSEPEFNAIIWLCDERECPQVTAPQQAAIRAVLESDDQVHEIRFRTSEQAYEYLVEILESMDQAEHAAALEPDGLPAAFSLVLARDAPVEDFTAKYQALPGVESVYVQAAPPGAPGGGEQWFPREEAADWAVAVFLCDGKVCPAITPQQQAALEYALEHDAVVLEVGFESKEQAHSRFQARFGHDEALMQDLEPDDLPASFRVVLREGASVEDFVRRYRDAVGVEAVVRDPDAKR